MYNLFKSITCKLKDDCIQHFREKRQASDTYSVQISFPAIKLVVLIGLTGCAYDLYRKFDY